MVHLRQPGIKGEATIAVDKNEEDNVPDTEVPELDVDVPATQEILPTAVDKNEKDNIPGAEILGLDVEVL